MTILGIFNDSISTQGDMGLGLQIRIETVFRGTPWFREHSSHLMNLVKVVLKTFNYEWLEL